LVRSIRLLAVVAALVCALQGAALGRTATREFPPFTGRVPVLLFHRVASPGFGSQMQRLHDLGFQAVSLDDYMRFMRGGNVSLPPRPVLLTFDDGYSSALAAADPVLARFGWSAALYVPTGFVGLPGHLGWNELRRLQATGRWEIDEHAGNGHVYVTVDAQGHRAPYYANEEWANGTRETFARYQARVSGDVERGARLLARFLPGWSSHGTFAVPFGDYGQRASDDRRIEPWFSSYLSTAFDVVFVQHGDSFTTPGEHFANRIAVSSSTDAGLLESRLRAGLGR
jgi:hypothetical protein